jgi:hypothetical protein
MTDEEFSTWNDYIIRAEFLIYLGYVDSNTDPEVLARRLQENDKRGIKRNVGTYRLYS